MFMINNIKLIMLCKFHQVRKFQGYDTLRLEGFPQPPRKVIDIRNMCVNIIADDQILLIKFCGHILTEKGLHDWYIKISGGGCCAFGWFNAKTRNVFCNKILQQVTVITGNFNNLAMIIQF